MNTMLVVEILAGVIVVLFLIIIIGISKFSMKDELKRQMKIMNDFVEENEEDLKKLSNKQAEINSGAVETTASAIKKGFTDSKKTDIMFCRYCGEKIESDSKFCRYCGKEQ